MFFDIPYVGRILPSILKAIPITLLITFLPLFLGTIFGLLIALSRNYRVFGVCQLAALYVSFIRGTPMFVLLFLFYYGLPLLLGIGVQAIPALFTGLVTFTFYCGAYLSEIIRGALKSVDMHQMEAARSIGMTFFSAYRRIIIPQAVVIALPNFFNYTAATLKNSSLVFAIGIIDVMASAKIAAEVGYRFIESYTTVAVLYVVFSVIFSVVFRGLEEAAKRRMGGLIDAK
jgi:His/Glu/Gln/Arg/opine family amino acid ABC transporter permease subunit